MLRVNLIDYLENHVALRLENGFVENAQLQEKEKKTVDKQDAEKQKNGKLLKKGKENKLEEKGEFTKEDAEELEALLKAFMV